MMDLLYPRDHLKEALALRAAKWLEVPALVQTLGELLDLIFFASLSTEEGDSISVQIVISPEMPLQHVLDSSEFIDSGEPAQNAWHVIPLAPQRLDLDSLVKLSVATELGRTAINIENNENSHWNIVGIARRNRETNGGDVLLLTTSAPGALSLFYADNEIMRYERGRLAKPAPDIFYTDGLVRTAIRSSLATLLSDVEGRLLMPQHIGERVFERLVRGMSATGRGGLILVQHETSLKPSESPPKHEVIATDILASKIRTLFEETKLWINTAFREDAADNEKSQAFHKRTWAQSSVDALSDDIARLTAMDGALLLGPDLHILGSGFKVNSHDQLPLYEAFDAAGQKVATTEYSLGTHGTRHRAAASFVASTGGFAFIASEDGPLKCLVKNGDRILFWRIRFPEI